MGALSKPIAEIERRLKAALAAGKILHGFKLEVCPNEDQEGLGDLPIVRILEPAMSERLEQNQMVSTPGTIMLSVSTRRDKGLAEHIIALEKAWDAIDCDINGQQELSLNATVVSMPLFTHMDFVPTANSLTTYFKCDFIPCQTAKGERRL